MQIKVKQIADLPAASTPTILYRENGSVTDSLADEPNSTRLRFGTVVRQDSVFSYAGNGTITINDNGWFKVWSNVSIENNRNQRSSSCVFLLKNGALVGGAVGFGYHRNRNEGQGTASIMALINVVSGDTITVQGQRYEGNGSLVTIPDSCSIMVEKV